MKTNPVRLGPGLGAAIQSNKEGDGFKKAFGGRQPKGRERTQRGPAETERVNKASVTALPVRRRRDFVVKNERVVASTITTTIPRN